MNQNVVVLEISSDEDDMWTDDNTAGVSGDGDGDDHKWLTELLDEVNQVKYGEDEVMVVNKSEKSGKKLKLNLKSSVELDDDDDDDDDCVVLENDPNETVDASNDNRSNGGGGGGSGGDDDDSDEIVVVSEKGQVACRDYPHSRHLCIKFPFSTTPNQSHCEQCYCYVCDSLAPCIYWGTGTTTTDHCHATDKDELWRHKRKTAKNGTKPIQPVHKLSASLKPVHCHRPASTPEPNLVQPRNHKSPNFQTPSIIRKNRHPLFSSRYKFHPDLVSQYRKTNNAKTNTYFSPRTQIQRPVLRNSWSDSVPRSSFVNPSRPLAPTAINAPNNLNPNFQSRVNFNAVFQQPYVAPPPPPRTQTVSSQPTYSMPAKQSYPVPNFAPKFSNGTQPRLPVTNPGFKEKSLNSGTEQGSATNEAENENGSSLPDVVPDEFTSYDWMFDSEPVGPGFTDLHGVYGLNDFSTDSGFIDPGPIFDL